MRSHAERERLTKEARGKNIVDVATSLGMGLVRQGKNFSWDQHDSFMIDTRKNFFYWNAQGFGGDPIKLVQTIKDCSFKEAVGYLTDSEIAKAAINTTKEKPFHYFLSDHKSISSAKDYLQNKRCLSEQTIDFALSQGSLAQSSYKDYKTGDTQPVIVFKALDQQQNVRGMTVQGVWEQKNEKRPYLKKTHGDGFLGYMLKVGEPPTNHTLSEDNPLKIIAFEAPIDLLSYYELFNKELNNTILVSMNGLRKGTISKCLANQLNAPITEAEKPDYLDQLDKRMNPNKLIQLVLAVDNDSAGKKFIHDFGIKNIDVSLQVPALMAGEEKSDWNQVLQRLKQPEIDPFKERIEAEKQSVTHRIDPIAKVKKTSRIDPVAKQAETPRINPSVTLK